MSQRIDQASRTIHAQPATVYRAFETAAALESWLPPEGMTGRLLAFDFREGGHYRMRLMYEAADHLPGKTSGDSDEVAVRFVKLVQDRRIEQAVAFDSGNTDFAGVMTMTWTFSPVPEGTEVTVRCENVPEGISPDDHRAGLTSTLENLARFTEQARCSSRSRVEDAP